MRSRRAIVLAQVAALVISMLGAGVVLSTPASATTPCTQAGGTSISDCSFEIAPAVTNPVYRPTTLAWTFSGASGVNGDGFGFWVGAGSSPDGTQAAFVQNGGYFEQSISGFASGSYKLKFQAAKGTNGSNNQPVTVSLDGTSLSTLTPTTSVYQQYSIDFTTTAGSHTLRFDGGSTATVNVVIDAVQLFQNTSPQSITFGALADRALAASPFSVSATATSGLAVTFSSSTASVCTVSGASVTLVATGICTITATQAGNGSYAAATPVTQSFSVLSATGASPPSKQPQWITYIGLDTTSDHYVLEAPTTLSGGATSGLPVSFIAWGACALTQGVISFPAAGTCTLAATQSGNDSYFSATPLISSFNVKVYRALPPAPLSSSLATCTADPAAGKLASGFTAAASGYHAQWAGQDAFPVIGVNQPFDWCLRLRNTGDLPWYAGSSATQVVIASSNTRDNTMAVDDGLMISNIYNRNRFAVQQEPIVLPGQYATFLIHLRAPSIPSKWRIDMAPVIDGVSWLEDSGIYLLFDAR